MRKAKASCRLGLKYSPEKEATLRELVRLLGLAGFVVRREKLKQGHGWKVLSGNCRLDEAKLIFVDTRLPQDEQINFILDRILALSISLAEADLEKLPPKVKEQILAVNAKLASMITAEVAA